MARKKLKACWDDVADICSRTLKGWRAFEPGRCETIELEGEGIEEGAGATYICDNDGRGFTLIYAWHEPENRWHDAEVHTVCCHVELAIIIRGLGPETVFRCPDCGRKCTRLALRRWGLRCAKCGDVVWCSEREGRVGRLVRRANIICQKLGLQSWVEQPMTKPKYMTARRYVSLLDQRQRVLAKIAGEMARRRRLYGAMPMHMADLHTAIRPRQEPVPANLWSEDYWG